VIFARALPYFLCTHWPPVGSIAISTLAEAWSFVVAPNRIVRDRSFELHIEPRPLCQPALAVEGQTPRRKCVMGLDRRLLQPQWRSRGILWRAWRWAVRWRCCRLRGWGKIIICRYYCCGHPRPASKSLTWPTVAALRWWWGRAGGNAYPAKLPIFVVRYCIFARLL